MKCHHPDVFCAALINAQPMGFYAVAQIVGDAREHGVEVRPVDINHSRWDCTLEPCDGRYMAVRLGLRMARELSNADAAAIVLARGETPYTSVEEIQRRANVGRGALDRIGAAGGFGNIAASRRQGLWDVKGLGNAALPLFAAADEREGLIRKEATEPVARLADMPEGQEVVEDYRTMGLSLRAHPLSFLRDQLERQRYRPCSELITAKDGKWINVAGLVLLRQKPGSAKGVMFITLEDETGIANLVVWPSLFEKFRRIVLGSSMMGVRGQVQREGDVIHLVANRLENLSPMLASVGTSDGPERTFPLARGDGAANGGGPDHRDAAERPLGRPARDIYIPDLRLGSGIIPGQPTEGIKVKTRDFR